VYRASCPAKAAFGAAATPWPPRPARAHTSSAGKTARFGLELDRIFAAAVLVFYAAVAALAMLVR